MLQLHCMSQSGNAYKVAFFLNHLGLRWEPVFVDFFNGITRNPDWRASTNAMGEAPVLVRHDGTRLSQSGAILTWLADTAPQLLAQQQGAGSSSGSSASERSHYNGADAEQRLEVLRWLLWDNHKFTSYLATYRFLRSFTPKAPEAAVLGFFRARVEAAFDVLERHLEHRAWVVGDAPTIADFSISGYLFYPSTETGMPLRGAGGVAGGYPAIAAWTDRLAALPGWVEPYALMPGARIEPKQWG